MAHIPSYRLHKPSGQAVVTLNGHDHYLGKHGTETSREAYDRLLGRWVAHGRRLPESSEAGATINEVLVAYWNWAHLYYRKNGRATSRLGQIKAACRPLQRRFGSETAAQFTPTLFRTVREDWIEAGHTRDTCNQYGSILKHLFTWAAEHEMVPGNVAASIRVVKGLARGRCEAPDSEPVTPVPLEDVEATLTVLGPIPAAMVQLQLATGMRPGEVCALRACDLLQDGPVWLYTPASHKTEHRGRNRTIALGPRSQAILGPFLNTGERTDRYLFHSRKGKGDRPVWPESYRVRIHAACDRVGVARWSPNRLRHNFATEVRKRFGLDIAQVMLGHAKADVTQLYAEVDREQMATIAAQIG